MDEKKIIEQLQDMTADTRVPENLAPENIMKTIGSKTKTKSRGKGFWNRNTKIAATLVSAAAVLLVATFAMNRPGGKITKDGMNTMTEAVNEVKEQECLVMAPTGNVSDYDEVYAEFKVYKDKYRQYEPTFFERLFGVSRGPEEYELAENAMTDMAVAETAAGAIADSAVNSADKGAGSSQYSKTNVQTEGIDEADIIKTDGRYIYYASTNLHTISIYSVNGDKSEMVSNIYVEGVGNLEEIYVDGDMLLCEGTSYRNDSYHVALAKYNITDRTRPEFVGLYTQEGSSVETRKIGNIVYIVTTVPNDVANIRKDKPETYIPYICDELIKADCIYIPDETENTTYTVISSVDVTGEMNMVDSAAVLGFNGTFYMGTENMYLYRAEWNYSDSDRMTDIRKLEYISDGNMGAITEGKIPGIIKDTFAINEYNGNLRVMTTSYNSYNNGESTNNVFVLDSSLKVIGSIEGLAKGERIYSARYMGDVAYFVTYRETDPLFSVDLSNPENPKIMGALKIPGFSEYLHNYDDGLLLGIGIEQIENKEGWREDYIKLSMFDTTDPYNVSEQDKMILYDANYAEALYNYKVVMIDPEKNIFGFMTEDYYRSEYAYRVFTYTERGFKEIVNVDLTYAPYGTRGVYVGNYVYIVNDDGVTAYELVGLK